MGPCIWPGAASGAGSDPDRSGSPRPIGPPGTGSLRTRSTAPGGGLEPPITGPEPVVLPITPPRKDSRGILTADGRDLPAGDEAADLLERGREPAARESGRPVPVARDGRGTLFEPRLQLEGLLELGVERERLLERGVRGHAVTKEQVTQRRIEAAEG